MSFEKRLFNENEKDIELNSSIWVYVRRFSLYLMILCLIIINLCAVSIALQCAKTESKGLFGKIFSALFAFVFGIIYIMVNYKYYRVDIKGDKCSICSTHIFPF